MWPGLNADRLDGHNASDFVLAGSATNATTLGGKTAGDFLGVGGKAADSNLLDGLDSTAFLRTTAKAADSDKLDGIDSTGFLASSTRISFSGTPFMTSGDTHVFPTVAGLTFKASCTGSGSPHTVHLTLDTDTGTAYFATTADSPQGLSQTTVTAAAGDVEVASGSSGDIGSNQLFPFQVVVVKDDGTVYNGVVTLAIAFASHDCFASGSLSS